MADQHDDFNPEGGLGGGFEGYPPTNHPEDLPRYNPAGAGYQTGNSYGSYRAEDFGPSATRPGDGRVRVFEALGWGFKAAFSNWKLWILGGLAVFGLAIFAIVLSAVLLPTSQEMTASGTGFNVLFTLVVVVLSVIVQFIGYRLVLRQIDNPHAQWSEVGKGVPWGTMIVVSLIIGAIFFALSCVAVLLLLVPVLTGASGPTPDELTARTFFLVLGLYGLIIVASLLIAPFFSLILWYACDGREGIGGSMTKGFKNAARNYLPLLGLSVLIGLINGFFFIAGFITIPATYLAMGHAYRQAASGPVPVTGREG